MYIPYYACIVALCGSLMRFWHGGSITILLTADKPYSGKYRAFYRQRNRGYAVMTYPLLDCVSQTPVFEQFIECRSADMEHLRHF